MKFKKEYLCYSLFIYGQVMLYTSILLIFYQKSRSYNKLKKLAPFFLSTSEAQLRKTMNQKKIGQSQKTTENIDNLVAILSLKGSNQLKKEIKKYITEPFSDMVLNFKISQDVIQPKLNSKSTKVVRLQTMFIVMLYRICKTKSLKVVFSLLNLYKKVQINTESFAQKFLSDPDHKQFVLQMSELMTKDIRLKKEQQQLILHQEQNQIPNVFEHISFETSISKHANLCNPTDWIIEEFLKVLQVIIKNAPLAIKQFTNQHHLLFNSKQQAGSQANQSKNKLNQSWQMSQFNFYRSLFEKIEQQSILVEQLKLRVNFPEQTLFLLKQTIKNKCLANLMVFNLEFTQNQNIYNVLQILSSLLRKMPRLTILSLKLILQEQSIKPFVSPIIVGKLFKAVAKHNPLMEKIALQNMIISLGAGQSIQVEDQNGLLKEISQKKKICQNSQNHVMLKGLKKMIKKCAYMYSLNVNNEKKSEEQTRRMTEPYLSHYNNFRIQLQRAKEVFILKGTNTQSFLNNIKVLESKELGFQTILGVMSKVQPFMPI